LCWVGTNCKKKVGKICHGKKRKVRERDSIRERRGDRLKKEGEGEKGRGRLERGKSRRSTYGKKRR